ncbi:MAG TPA: hypothetical protein PK517_00865 [Nitrosomonas sp.]|nr:hypothetical protein [Nitrosomonas sp.]
MINDGKSLVDRNYVKDVFEKNLELIQQPQERAEEIIRIIRDRTGVLLEAAPLFYAFAHSIIHDYLAAMQSSRHDVDYLLKKIEDPKWEEIIIFAVAANPRERDFNTRYSKKKSNIGR